MTADIIVFLQAAVATVLFVAAISKLASGVRVDSYLEDLGIPQTAGKVIGRLIAPAEVLIAAIVVIGVLGIVSAAVASVLAIAFVLIQLNALRMGARGCQCFGFDNGSAGLLNFARAVCFAAASLALVVAFAGHVGALDTTPVGWSRWPEALSGCTASVAAIAGFALLQQVVTFQRSYSHHVTAATAEGAR